MIQEFCTSCHSAGLLPPPCKEGSLVPSLQASKKRKKGMLRRRTILSPQNSPPCSVESSLKMTIGKDVAGIRWFGSTIGDCGRRRCGPKITSRTKGAREMGTYRSMHRENSVTQRHNLPSHEASPTSRQLGSTLLSLLMSDTSSGEP